MKYLLHIDTSTDTGAVALSAEGNLVAGIVNEESRNHAGTLNNMINNLLDEEGISFEDISAIAVCGGPGSYTGLRIGLSTAKGICYASNKPLILNNRLTLLAHQGWVKNKGMYSRYTVILNARIKEYFVAMYDDNFECILEPQHKTEDQLLALKLKDENVFIISNVPEETKNKPGVNNLKIDANITIDLKSWSIVAYEDYKCNNIVNLTLAEPFYLKQVYTHN